MNRLIFRCWITCLAASLPAIAACAGASADAPLRVKLGIPRDQATTELRAAKFCHKQDGPPQPLVTFARCERVGAEWGEAWVTARFEQERLVELRRYERFTDDERAIERFNQLVAARLELSPEAASTEPLQTKGALEPGTRIVKAFQVDPSTIIGVYLLTPTPPEDASVLEAVIRIAP